MKYKVGDKVKYDNEVVTIVGYVRNLNWYLVQGYSNGWRKTNDSYETHGIKVPNMTCGLMWANPNSLEPVTNRSKVGKKAYKTFIKNGGQRDIRGRFTKEYKKEKTFNSITLGDKTYYFDPVRGVSMEFFDNRVFIYQPDDSYVSIFLNEDKKIDWEKIGEYINEAYKNTSGLPSHYPVEHAKAYAKVFQKHGLISKEIEI